MERSPVLFYFDFGYNALQSVPHHGMIGSQTAPQLLNENPQGFGIEVDVLVAPVLGLQFSNPRQRFVSFPLPLSKRNHDGWKIFVR
jgi:hypothetical protein